MDIKKSHWFGIGFGFAVLVLALFFIGENMFFFLIGMGMIIVAAPFVLSTITETKEENEKEEMFLEFARNLVESGKTGVPISRSIINIKDKNFGILSDHIKKLANQIYIGIPLGTALKVFSEDVKNKTISRAITLIGQAEKSTGEIEVSNAFFYLLIIQGLFSGLTVGKLAEKNFKAGIKHSFILMILAFMVSSTANFFFGG